MGTPRIFAIGLLQHAPRGAHLAIRYPLRLYQAGVEA